MPGNHVVRLRAGLVVSLGAVLLLPCAVQAQVARKVQVVARPPQAESSAVFSEAKARAKESSKPLVVIGTSDTCSYCAAFKKGLAAQPELQDLLTQYVSIELPFGGTDFRAIVMDIIRQDPNSLQALGAPSVFIFTTKGDVVYAGPNTVGGMQAGEEFKRLLITGIERNQGVRSAAKSKAVPRLWKSKMGQFSVTASLVSFDGKSALLRTEEGKNITVALDALSVEDQEFLKTAKPRN
jgi:thioredoxin-related protein